MIDLTTHESVEGYPSFVRRSSENPAELNWWAPRYYGDDVNDYLAGEKHFENALSLLKGLRDPTAVDFYAGLIAPMAADPRSILGNIVDAMAVSGSMERGFIYALTMKAVAGRAPAVGSGPGMMEEDRFGEEHAHLCLELARATGPGVLYGELISIIDQTFDSSMKLGFIWTICASALAGASN